MEIKPHKDMAGNGRMGKAPHSAGKADGREASDPFGLGEGSITDSVQYIAGSIERILQELQLEVCITLGMSGILHACVHEQYCGC